MTVFDFKEVPGKTGIYIFKDNKGKVLYVGKAKNLKSRLKSYLRPASDSRERIVFLMNEAYDYEFFLTGTEREALLLENNLIKKHRPPYNVFFRDDKDYLCVRVDLSKDFPKFNLVRKVAKDGAIYFGPFSSAKKIRNLLGVAGKLFPMRTCTDSSFKRRQRPCMQYQIKRCYAPCVGYISREEYRKVVNDAVSFFRGDYRGVVRRLKKDMGDYSRSLMFEKAAEVRDRLSVIESLAMTQSVVNARLPDSDILGVHVEDGRGAVSLMFLRNLRVIDVRSFMLNARHIDRKELVSSVLSQYYTEDAYIPDEIILPLMPEDTYLKDHISRRLGRRVDIRVPRRGMRKKLVSLAEKNAKGYFEARRKKELGYEEMMDYLQSCLDLSRPPVRIECFDVSHHGGKSPVGSMVVFEYGIPRKDHYRRFRVRNVEGVDDCAMLGEVLMRRFGKDTSFGGLADLIVIDGGRGQLNAGVKAAGNYDIDLDIISIAKEKVDRAKGDDRIYLQGRKNPVKLKQGDPALNYLKRIRDEAHRFAISYHRLSEEREKLRSLLADFPGIGKIRTERLISNFGSVRGVMECTPDQIASLLKIRPVKAEEFLSFLKNNFLAPDNEQIP